LDINLNFENEIIYDDIKGTLTKNLNDNSWNFFQIKFITKIYQFTIQPINNNDIEELKKIEINQEEVFLSLVPCDTITTKQVYKNTLRMYLNTLDGEKIPIRYKPGNFHLLNKHIRQKRYMR